MNFDELRQMSVGALIALADVAHVVAPILERALEAGVVEQDEREAITAVIYLLGEPANTLLSRCVPPSPLVSNQEIPHGWLRTTEVVDMCGVSGQSVRNASDSPALPLVGVKVRGRRYYDPTSVEPYKEHLRGQRH